MARRKRDPFTGLPIERGSPMDMAERLERKLVQPSRKPFEPRRFYAQRPNYEPRPFYTPSGRQEIHHYQHGPQHVVVEDYEHYSKRIENREKFIILMGICVFAFILLGISIYDFESGLTMDGIIYLIISAIIFTLFFFCLLYVPFFQTQTRQYKRAHAPMLKQLVILSTSTFGFIFFLTGFIMQNAILIVVSLFLIGYSCYYAYKTFKRYEK